MEETKEALDKAEQIEKNMEEIKNARKNQVKSTTNTAADIKKQMADLEK